jgi:hypothetical protein
MAIICRALLVVFACSYLSACDEPPTAFDPFRTSPPSTVLITWSFGLSDGLTSVRALGLWVVPREQGSNASADLTFDGTWESTAPAIMRVVAPGQIASVSPGDAELRLTYRGKTVTRLVRVYAGEPPFWVIRPEELPSVGGSVRDTTLPPGAQGIAGVKVEILTGHNAGRSSVTDARALYNFDAPFICGPGTLRATKPGYRDLTESAVFCDQTSSLPSLVITPSP